MPFSNLNFFANLKCTTTTFIKINYYCTIIIIIIVQRMYHFLERSKWKYKTIRMLFLYISFRTVTLWRITRTLLSMSTMLVISGLPFVTTAAVAGISPSMEPSAALLELLTVHSTCEQAETIIFIVTATLKVTAITFRKERCEWDSRLESASQDRSLLTPTLVGIQWIVSSLKKYRKLSSKLVPYYHLDISKKERRVRLVLYFRS